MPSRFDSKIFNPEVFSRYMTRVPRVKQNKLLESGILRTRSDIAPLFAAQAGGNYATVPMKGLLDGDPVNYDGSTDLTASGTKTFSQSMVVVGRGKGWKERDFSADITGEDFMENVAAQVTTYWDDVDQTTLLAILKGVFAMTGNDDFASKHTKDVTGDTTNTVDATTLNTAIQKASGANKNIFKLVITHSAVATNLENLNVVTYLKYTDAQGVERDLGLATWNGRLLLIDDDMPVRAVAAVYAKTSDVALTSGKTYYTRSGSANNYVYTAVAAPAVANIGTYYECTAEAYTEYTTYVLGEGAFDFVDVGAENAYETWRDPKTNGGEDYLFTRQRKLFAPFGISFTKTSMATTSPTNEELENGANWALVNDGNGSYINHKAIPITRIISRG